MGVEKVNVMKEKEKVVREKVMVGSEGTVGRGKGGGVEAEREEGEGGG